MYIGLRVKYRYSCQTLMELELSRQFFENNQILNFKKTRAMGAELLLVDGQTDRYDEDNSPCAQFCKST